MWKSTFFQDFGRGNLLTFFQNFGRGNMWKSADFFGDFGRGNPMFKTLNIRFWFWTLDMRLVHICLKKEMQ
ncbi:unnamed protein product [Rhizophagus irregularis]|nr:unnamed protein product [Rhizophagus irregularis]